MSDERTPGADGPDDLSARLANAFPSQVPDGVRIRHRVAIDESLGQPAGAGLRRVAVVGAVGAVVAVPVAAAASEGALPGDALYPVKRATEVVRSVVDGDIVAEHRVEEAEALAARQAAGSDQVVDLDAVERTVTAAIDAVESTTRFDDDDELRVRAVAVADQVGAELAADVVALPDATPLQDQADRLQRRLERERAERLRLAREREQQASPSPSPTPSDEPSPEPTRTATKEPSDEPTDAAPSDEPTVDASPSPTTDAPSPSPSPSPTRTTDRPSPSPTPTRSPSPSPSPSPTRTTDRPSPSPTPTPSPSPSPTRSPSPSPTPTASPTPAPSPTRDTQPVPRRERYTVRDGGHVVVEVTERGIRLFELQPADDAWFVQADRAGEPERLSVTFTHRRDGRRYVFRARYLGDGRVETSVSEA